MNKYINIVIVESKKVLCDMWRQILLENEDFIFGGKYLTLDAAFADMPYILPHVIIMDIDLIEKKTVEVIKLLKEKFPKTKCLVSSDTDGDERVVKAIGAGATGNIIKTDDGRKLLDVCMLAYNGGAPMSIKISKMVVTSFQQNNSFCNENCYELSKREIEVLQLLSTGLLYKEAADNLNISVDTIRNHCQKIYRKLQVKTRQEAVNMVYYRRL